MASLEKEQKDMYSKVFSDCWKLLSDHGNPQTDQDWEEWIRMVGEISQKYRSKLCDDLLRKITDEVERRWKDAN